MTYESAHIPVSVEEMVQHYDQLAPDDQCDAWTQSEYVAAFPHIVTYLLSPDGLATYTPETRAAFFHSALQALVTFPLGRRMENVPIINSDYTHRQHTDEPTIACSGYVYNVAHETAELRLLKDTEPDDVTNLLHVDLAGIIALGMSLPDTEAALQAIIETYAHTPVPQTLKNHLSLLLPQNSTSRRWIKQHGFDAALGYEWDEMLASLLLNYPERVIRPEHNKPVHLPGELNLPELQKFYSAAAMRVFLEYAANYATQIRFGPAANRELIDFSLWIRKMPRDFLADIDVQIDLLTIIGATGGTIPEASGKIVSARDYLHRYAPHRSRERFVGLRNRGVHDLKR